ncbi:hypothetical protein GCM10008908_34610 [Clostridium subterminale]|uniref:Uncharacterized protein n=1 Tax=Clostridium subterminale TaxID=1550 RepID=A0ABP3W5Y7_CLOSU
MYIPIYVYIGKICTHEHVKNEHVISLGITIKKIEILFKLDINIKC